MTGVDCRAGWWPAGAALAIDGFFASIAFDIHLEDSGVMDEAIDCGERHGLSREDSAPFTEGLIGGDQDGSTLVAPGGMALRDRQAGWQGNLALKAAFLESSRPNPIAAELLVRVIPSLIPCRAPMRPV